MKVNSHIWLSVDPLSDKYPSLSPYAYCANNPVVLVDPDGMSFGIPPGADMEDCVVIDMKPRWPYIPSGTTPQPTESGKKYSIDDWFDGKYRTFEKEDGINYTSEDGHGQESARKNKNSKAESVQETVDDFGGFIPIKIRPNSKEGNNSSSNSKEHVDDSWKNHPYDHIVISDSVIYPTKGGGKATAYEDDTLFFVGEEKVSVEWEKNINSK